MKTWKYVFRVTQNGFSSRIVEIHQDKEDGKQAYQDAINIVNERNKYRKNIEALAEEDLNNYIKEIENCPTWSLIIVEEVI